MPSLMIRRYFRVWKIAFLGMLVGTAVHDSSAVAAPPQHPNIVIILADDKYEHVVQFEEFGR